MSYLRGIDTSHWQGTEPSHVGLSFEFARATFGTTKDDKYDFHRAHALADGLAFGAYHFGDKTKGVDEQLKAHLAASPGESCSVLDIEAGNMSLANGIRFITGLHDAGRNVGLYMSASGFDWHLGQDFDWVASWMASPPAGPWEFWQYHGGPLDLDYYRGTKEQLFALLEGSGSDMNSYPVPKVPSDVMVATNKVLYPSDALTATDPNRVIVSPGRRMPYHGGPAGIGIVEYVSDTGVHSGKTYFAHAADLTNLAAIPMNDAYTKATQDAAVAAQKTSDQAAITAANAAAAKAQADLRTAAGQERERIALARGNAEADTIRTT